jgi:hypothetical protein
MSTYLKEVSPAKMFDGSDVSMLFLRTRVLCRGGRKQSGLHSSAIAAPLRVRQCVCTRVSAVQVSLTLVTDRDSGLHWSP